GIPERGEFLAPEPADRDYRFADRNSGPFYFDYSDHRTRDTLREEISFFVPDRGGSHDLKLGGLLEQEGFSRLRHQRPILQPSGLAQSLLLGQTVRTIGVLLPTRAALNNRASGDHFGLFIQDTYKPLTNLTLGLGLRFDRETIGAWGYVPFDPSAERRQFDHLMALAGVEIQSGDLNSDGILAFDLSGDPLYGPGSTRVLVLDSNLALAAPRHFTRHNYLTPIFSSALQTLGVQDPLVLQGGRPRQRQDFSITNNNLAPRLSVTWDPLSKGKSKGFASWGRFYGNLFLQTVVGEQGPDLRGVYYVYDPGGVTDQGLPDHQLGDLISGSPPSATQVDRNLKTPFTDEMMLGWEQEIAPEVSLSLTYVRRRYREQLQDIDINHTIRRPPFCKQTVTPAGDCDDFGITLPPPSGVRDAVFVRV